MERCKPLSSLNSFLSYAPQLFGANPVSLFTLLPVFIQLLSNYYGGSNARWMAVLGAIIHIWRPEIADGCDIVEGSGTPLQYYCLETSMDGGA